MIRDVETQDAGTTIDAAEASGLFSPEEIPVLRAQLETSLAGSSDRAEFWIADFDEDGRALGAAYCAEEKMTDRVWNLLFIGVRKERQREGVGARLLESVEKRLSSNSQRMLIIETTGGDEFEAARTFYGEHGYSQEGTVRDFYADGMDKIVFRKRL